MDLKVILVTFKPYIPHPIDSEDASVLFRYAVNGLLKPNERVSTIFLTVVIFSLQSSFIFDIKGLQAAP